LKKEDQSSRINVGGHQQQTPRIISTGGLQYEV